MTTIAIEADEVTLNTFREELPWKSPEAKSVAYACGIGDVEDLRADIMARIDLCCKDPKEKEAAFAALNKLSDAELIQQYDIDAHLAFKTLSSLEYQE